MRSQSLNLTTERESEGKSYPMPGLAEAAKYLPSHSVHRRVSYTPSDKHLLLLGLLP
jgi:hypothetical protein